MRWSWTNNSTDKWYGNKFQQQKNRKHTATILQQQQQQHDVAKQLKCMNTHAILFK